jgi:hypothetical protein
LAERAARTARATQWAALTVEEAARAAETELDLIEICETVIGSQYSTRRVL